MQNDYREAKPQNLPEHLRKHVEKRMKRMPGCFYTPDPDKPEMKKQEEILADKREE